MQLSDKAVQEFKEIFEKEHKIKLSDSEARESAQNLMNFMEIIYDQAVTEARRKKRLENEPNGFNLENEEGTYNCRVCHRSASGINAWWDLNGVKCLDCQRNIEEGVISSEICDNDKIWFKDWQLESKLKIHSSTIRKLRREGKLTGIDLKTKDGINYFTVYMLKDNIRFLKSFHSKKSKA